MTMLPPEHPFDVRCGACEHKWSAAYIPMELGNFAKLIKGLSCPMCGQDSSKLFHWKSKEPDGNQDS